MKILRIGDPHIKVSNLKEAEALMKLAYHIASTESVDRIEILGDLFHTHAVLRLEVLEFWDGWLDSFPRVAETVVLVGNHDQTGDYSSESHALSVYKRSASPNLKIIDKPTKLGLFAYVPYVHDEKKFTEAANSMADQGARVLVCHQTFQGSKWDNGMYAPDGFDVEALRFDLVISGHIHKRQRYGKIIYPGTAKWDTASDANEEKGLWLVTHSLNGTIQSESFISTDSVCTPIYSLQWREGEEIPAFPEKSKTALELIGTSEWVSHQRKKLKGKVSLSTKITDSKKRENRKSGNSLEHFILNTFDPLEGIDRAEMFGFMRELGLV